MTKINNIEWSEIVQYLNDIMNLKPVLWINKHKDNFEEASKKVAYSMADVQDAEARLERFAPFIMQEFP